MKKLTIYGLLVLALMLMALGVFAISLILSTELIPFDAQRYWTMNWVSYVVAMIAITLAVALIRWALKNQ